MRKGMLEVLGGVRRHAHGPSTVPIMDYVRRPPYTWYCGANSYEYGYGAIALLYKR